MGANSGEESPRASGVVAGPVFDLMFCCSSPAPPPLASTTLWTSSNWGEHHLSVRFSKFHHGIRGAGCATW